MMNQPLIPLGYYLLRRIHTKYFPPGCPPEYISVAGCLCEAAIPDADSTPVASSRFNPAKLAEKWDILPEQANELFQFNRRQDGQINYAMFNYRSSVPALQVKNTFFHGRDDVLMIGLCTLDPDFLINADVRRVSPLPENGNLLGFDLYEIGNGGEEGPRRKPDYAAIGSGTVCGLSCSIWCCDADGRIPEMLGVSLNRFGLYRNAEDAVRAADLVNRERLGEPVWYLPLALIRYES